jgi:hypothetical protein
MRTTINGTFGAVAIPAGNNSTMVVLHSVTKSRRGQDEAGDAEVALEHDLSAIESEKGSSDNGRARVRR